MTLCQERTKRTALRAFHRMVDRFPELVTKRHQCPIAVDRHQPSQMFFSDALRSQSNTYSCCPAKWLLGRGAAALKRE